MINNQDSGLESGKNSSNTIYNDTNFLKKLTGLNVEDKQFMTQKLDTNLDICPKNMPNLGELMPRLFR